MSKKQVVKAVVSGPGPVNPQTIINPRPVGYKYQISYFDHQGNLRQRYITANNERDALVDSWLNNKNVVEPVSVRRV